MSDEELPVLAKITTAKRAKDSEHERLKELVIAAVDSGVPITRVAEAAGVNRITVYRWLGRI